MGQAGSAVTACGNTVNKENKHKSSSSLHHQHDQFNSNNNNNMQQARRQHMDEQKYHHNNNSNNQQYINYNQAQQPQHLYMMNHPSGSFQPHTPHTPLSHHHQQQHQIQEQPIINHQRNNTHPVNSNTNLFQYEQHNPLYNTNQQYLSHRSSQPNISSYNKYLLQNQHKRIKKSKTITKRYKKPPKLKRNDDVDSDDLSNDNNHDHDDNDLLTPNTLNNKRRIQYRERHETISQQIPQLNNDLSFIKYDDHSEQEENPTKPYRKQSKSRYDMTDKQYSKYKKYKKLRSKYIKMYQFIDNLLSLNPKNLQHILMLRKTDNININNFYRYIISENKEKNKLSMHLPELKRVSECLSFYAVSFKPINNFRKLWHILLQDRCRKNIMITESLVQEWIGQLLFAVNFLHSHNIVHLDISPESILISSNLKHLILSGFDASMLVNDHITYNISCELLNCCWQLPPTIRRRNDFNGFEFKSFDMWSIGVLTFLLLTAKFPFFKDKNSKRIPESQYVKNEQKISHSARDFISKLLSSSITNRLTVTSALHHPWIKNKRQNTINIDGTIYYSMHQHHQQKLKNKYQILQQQTKKYLFISDQKKLNKKIKKLNKKIIKYQTFQDDDNDDFEIMKKQSNKKRLSLPTKTRKKPSNKYLATKPKRSSLNIIKSNTKYLPYNDYATQPDVQSDEDNNNNSDDSFISSSSDDDDDDDSNENSSNDDNMISDDSNHDIHIHPDIDYSNNKIQIKKLNPSHNSSSHNSMSNNSRSRNEMVISQATYNIKRTHKKPSKHLNLIDVNSKSNKKHESSTHSMHKKVKKKKRKDRKHNSDSLRHSNSTFEQSNHSNSAGNTQRTRTRTRTRSSSQHTYSEYQS